MKKITEIDVKDKKVILRCDLNVSHKNGEIINDEKIIASLKTINYLIKENSKVIIMSHLGKVKTEEDKLNNSLEIVFKRLKELLGVKVYFSKDTRGSKLEALIAEMNYGEVLLIENTRFEDLNDKKESNCDLELSRYWASLGEVFINDAFGLTHRRHASNSGIPIYIESGIGFLIEKEVENLNLLINPERPFTVIMGGAKIGDKINLISSILNKCDYLLLGGGIANTFLSISHEVGKSLISEESVEEVKKLLLKYQDKIIMPVDVVTLNGDLVEVKSVLNVSENDKIYDIGPKTIKLYEEYINKSLTIFINGTPGMYEDERFKEGTKSLLEITSKSKAKTILGGGDALASAINLNIKDFHFMSTGGGATLNYIGTEKMLAMEEKC